MDSITTATQPKQTATNDKIKFPVVAYSGGELITSDEKKRIEEKLINPITDYYNENGINLVSLNITVPPEAGNEYTIDAIFADGVRQSFLFGKREKEYGYWSPSCLEPCEFSTAFKAKYPQIVK